MSAFALSCLFTGCISLAFGLFVALTNLAARPNRLFGLVSLGIALWSIGLGFLTEAPDYQSAIRWLHVHYVGAILIPVLFLHFVLALLNRDRAFIRYSAYGFGSVLMFLNLSGKLADVVPKAPFSYYTAPLLTYPAFVAFFFSAVLYAHALLLKEYSTSVGQRREQLKYLFVGSAVGFVGSSTAFFPVFDWPIFPYGVYLVSLYILIIGYSIIRYRLMEITAIIHKGVAYGFLLAVIFIPTYLAVAASERATLYSVPPLLAGTLVAACGLWALLRQPRNIINLTFSLLCGAVGIWLFGSFMVYSSADEAEADFWSRCTYVGVVCIPAVFYHLTSCLVQHRMPGRLIATNYLLSMVFLLLLPTPYLLDGNFSYFWGHYPRAGLLHPLFLLYFGLASGWALFRIYQEHLAAQRINNGRDASHLRTLFWTFAVAYVSSLDFAQTYGHEFYPVGYVLASISILVATRTIIADQSLDSARVPPTPRTLLFVQTLGLIPVYIVVLLLIRLFTGTTQYLLTGILLATFLIFAGALAGIQKRVEKAIARLLFRERHDAYETLTEFSKAMVTILDLSTLTTTIMDTLVRALGIETISIFLLDKEKSHYYLAAAHGLDFDEMKTVTFTASASLPEYLARTRSIAMLEELRHDPHHPVEKAVLDSLRHLRAELCIPLVNKDSLIGFFNFGHRIDRRMYSEADLALLTTLAQNAAVALDNALLYDDLRRSRMLMRRTDRLRSLETIAGGFAHEIRNPLTSIKTFVQLAPERKHDDEFIRHFSQIVHEDVLRIERLIQEILDYARYMEPKFSLESLNDVVASYLYFVEVKGREQKHRGREGPSPRPAERHA